MGAIGNLINDVGDAAFGRSSGTTLQTFLSKFSSTDAKHVNVINPLATFDAKIKFYPCIDPTKNNSSNILDKIGSALKDAGTNMLNNLVNNALGGLVGSWLNDDEDRVMNKHDSFQMGQEKSFLNMLAEANMLVGGSTVLGESAIPEPLEIQLGYYVQNATIPRIKMNDGGKSTTLVGEFPINGEYVTPDNNQLQLDILCTKLPLHERIFYPWLKEITLPYWSYKKEPYTTATITLDFSKHTDIQYVFYGCRPQQIDLIQPTQEPQGTITRQVTFIFDVMAIQSKSLAVIDSVKERLAQSAQILNNGLMNMMNV